MKASFVRRIDGDQYFFNIILVGIATILLTRAYLSLAGYPTIGGSLLHVAHVLWGGLFLLAASILGLSFHGKKVRVWSSILAGMGFGLFIDEIGKFLTHDNDYFFQPAIVIIYLIFIFLFIIYSRTKNNKAESPKGLLYNSLELLEEVIEKDFEAHEKKNLLEDLNKVIESKEKPYANLAKKLKIIIRPMKTKTTNKSFLHRFWAKARNFHKYFGKKPLFATMTVLLAINGVASIFNGFYNLIIIFIKKELFLDQVGVQNLNNPLVYITGISLLSALISAIFVVRGFYFLIKKQRRKALQLFKTGLLIRILITHLFTFYFEQFSATVSVLIDVLFFFAVEYLIREMPEDLNKK